MSVNQRFERRNLGLSIPFTQDDYWGEGGELDPDIQYSEIHAKDHELLSITAMNQAADWIHGRIQAGKRVYVHCRGGVGRSAMAVAAYFIKYGKDTLSLEAICKHIKKYRKAATIFSKLPALAAYNTSLGRNNRAENSPAFKELLAQETAQENTGKKLKADKTLVKEIMASPDLRSGASLMI